MTREEAQEYAKTMTYRDAINNLMRAKSIPYRKATFVKITELLKALEQEPILDKIRAEIEQAKAIMNEEIIEHDRKDLINFINGINQCLMIIDKYRQEG